jgi:hypothetical protein
MLVVDGAVVTAVEGELLLQATAVRTTTSATGKKFLMTPFPRKLSVSQALATLVNFPQERSRSAKGRHEEIAGARSSRLTSAPGCS